MLKKIKQIDYKAVTNLEEFYVIAIEELWDDLGIKECYDRWREYQITDSAISSSIILFLI